MKRIATLLILLLITLSPALPGSPLHVVTTYRYIADIVNRIGGDNVTVYALARGDYNPHIILPRPSFIAKVRQADLLIINGAQLEIGWLPPLVRQANNPAVQPGKPGFLDLSGFVALIDVPTVVSREMGDIHPEGNPHYYLDPENIPILAKAVTNKLCELDPSHREQYESNRMAFDSMWSQKLEEWKKQMLPFKDTRLVEYHKVFDYFLRRYDLPLAGTVEPLPGIPPTAAHTEYLESILAHEPARFILQDVYNPDDASRLLADKLNMTLVVLPHDVGSVDHADDVVSLFDEMIRRITQ